MILKLRQQLKLMQLLYNSLPTEKDIIIKDINGEIIIEQTEKESNQLNLANLMSNVVFNKPFNVLNLQEESKLLNMLTIAFRQVNTHYFNMLEENKKQQEEILKKYNEGKK